MKKVLIVFIFCFIAVFTTYLLTNFNPSFDGIAVDMGSFANKITGKTTEEYSDGIKINKLQMSNATTNFNLLNDNQKKMYTAVVYAVKELDSVVTVDNYFGDDIEKISEDVKIVMSAFFADHPEVFYVKLSYKISLSKNILSEKIRIDLSYTINDKNELDTKIDQMDEIIQLYIANLENKSDFEKELIIHDALALDTKYYSEITDISKVPEQYHTIYGTFIEKQAVCDGFAKAMQILLDRVGIENIFVTGMLGEVPHAWNMVKLENEWYHLDLTSNKYIKEADGSTKTVVHTYFNVTDEFIQKSHIIDNKELNPLANAQVNNYYTKTNSYISTTDDFDRRIKELVQVQNNKNALEFATDVIDVPTKLLNVLYDINFNGYKNAGNTVKMKYYNELNTYIVQKE